MRYKLNDCVETRERERRVNVFGWLIDIVADFVYIVYCDQDFIFLKNEIAIFENNNNYLFEKKTASEYFAF